MMTSQDSKARRAAARVLVALALLAPLSPAAAAQGGWRLVWGDEFEGAKGTAVDATKWTREVGGQGWGNNERQYYTNTARNARLDGKGNLSIAAIKQASPAGTSCWYGPCQYTSARLITKGKFSQRYGRFEARMKLPEGQGIWPAFWMLGDTIDSAGWPTAGELDIMENIGREPRIVHGTVHGPGYSGANGIGRPYTLPKGSKFSTDFHVFAVEWEPEAIRWYVDGNLYNTVTPSDLPQGAAWVFDHPFFLLLNLAVGGNWPGDPNATTKFPQKLLVDYVRVYERE